MLMSSISHKMQGRIGRMTQLNDLEDHPEDHGRSKWRFKSLYRSAPWLPLTQQMKRCEACAELLPNCSIQTQRSQKSCKWNFLRKFWVSQAMNVLLGVVSQVNHTSKLSKRPLRPHPNQLNWVATSTYLRQLAMWPPPQPQNDRIHSWFMVNV